MRCSTASRPQTMCWTPLRRLRRIRITFSHSPIAAEHRGLIVVVVVVVVFFGGLANLNDLAATLADDLADTAVVIIVVGLDFGGLANRNHLAATLADHLADA